MQAFIKSAGKRRATAQKNVRTAVEAAPLEEIEGKAQLDHGRVRHAAERQVDGGIGAISRVGRKLERLRSSVDNGIYNIGGSGSAEIDPEPLATGVPKSVGFKGFIVNDDRASSGCKDSGSGEGEHSGKNFSWDHDHNQVVYSSQPAAEMGNPERRARRLGKSFLMSLVLRSKVGELVQIPRKGKRRTANVAGASRPAKTLL